MKIQNSVAFVTGANRGLGQHFVEPLFARGAKKVYAAARDPDSIKLKRVERLRLDVTRPEQIADAARQCGDVTLLINNAGIARGPKLLDDNAFELAREEFETNFFGVYGTSRAFAPILAANGGGGLINILSVLSWISMEGVGTYCASKAATWSLTNGLRNELAAQRTQVVGVHVGMMDTDMTKDMVGEKSDPALVVKQVLDGLEAGKLEILADAISRQVKQGLSANPGVYLGAAQE